MKAQRGAAILTAMLTVVLVATLASTTLWQQWRGVEVEAAERSRAQSTWVLIGALDWARLILREDARKGGADHLAEPWSIALEQARLSTFLAADRSDTLAADATQNAFLSGQIIDLQSRLNVFNLVQADAARNEPSRRAFARLFKHLSLPESELARMTEQLRLAKDTASNKAPNPTAPLWPQTFEQLGWVGLSARSLAALRPYVTMLPEATSVNLNTAPAEVIYASAPLLELADAHRLVAARSATHFETLADANQVLAKAGRANPLVDGQHSVSTRFFEIRGFLRIDDVTVQEQSVVRRDGLSVTTLWRRRGVVPAMPLLQ